MPSLTPRRAGAVLVLLVAASTVVRFAAARSVPVPWIAPDEMTYALLGRSLYATGHLTILGHDTPFYSLLYPALAGAPLSIGDLARGFSLLQGLQALVMSSTAVIVYLWGRAFLTRGWALVAAALSLTPPALAYSADVMTETLFLPLATLAAWTLARALDEPTRRRQALFAAALAAAVLTRLQAIVFLPVLVTGLFLAASFQGERGYLRRFVPLGAALAAVGLAWSAWQLRNGGPWTKAFGAYAAVGAEPYHVGESAKFAAWHAADVGLLVVGFPLLALLVLVWEALRRRESSADARAFLVVAVSTVVWLTVEVGVFASRHVGRLAERDLIAVLPLAFLAFALWLQRGAPRPQPASSAIALVVAVPLLALPVTRLSTLEAAPDAFMTIPLQKLAAQWGSTALETAWYAGVAAVVAAFVLLPRRAAPVLAGIVALALAGASVVASREVGALARDRAHRYFGDADRGWIDAAARGPVAILYDGGGYWPSVWHQVLWNERIGVALHFPDSPLPGPLPQRAVGPRFDGYLFSPDGGRVENRWLVAPTTFTLVGERVADLPQHDLDRAGLALWHTSGPPRISTWTTGFQPNGDILGAARVIVYACGRGRLEVTFLGKEAKPVEILVDGVRAARRVVPGGGVWQAAVTAPPRADGRGSCTFDILSQGLLGSTRVEFVRS